ncbi:MAG: ATP-dependent helicase [bacterium]|nr:ATP-dependent helicase [bacterium]
MPASLFAEEYKKLNKAQKEAVDTIDGPVMVVAGPGTGKTQILALRIGNILNKTDIKADGILCLTFTNSGVKAMKERLRAYIGTEAGKVHVSTFHSFGMNVVEKYFGVLGQGEMPKLMDEKDSIAISDGILQDNSWVYLKPRSDNSRYFSDLKSLISFLKRERINPIEFEKLLREEIKNIQSDPDSISTRGESKGKLKKEIEKKIEGLERTGEAMRFYEFYEQVKTEKNFFDYDDVLENLVKIVEESEDAGAYIRENYQYVLIDEHQDSSGVQNEFLQKVWGEVENPNIFVVGDDRQLIYGFGGASLEYFENFKHAFGKAKLVMLVENYRSTQGILDSAHKLLQSSISKEKLKSNSKENHPINLVEANYERDEIILAGLAIQNKIKEGINPNDFALLVPKNRHVRSAMTVLRDMGLSVATGEKVNFFDSPVATSFIRVLNILANPADGGMLAESFFDPLTSITPIEAHKFIRDNNMRQFSFLDAMEEERQTLFKEENSVKIWIAKLKGWFAFTTETSVYPFVQKVAGEFLLDTAKNHEDLVSRVEVVRTVLHLVLAQAERNPKLTLKEFLIFLERLEEYGQNIPLASFDATSGVKVLTLHGSKGLEFDFVWIAHMDEKSLAGARRGGFTLPESVSQKMEERDEEVIKRELYVAITRAKRFCTISYSTHSYTGGDRTLSGIVSNLENNFTKQTADETEKIILAHDPKAYTESKGISKENMSLQELKKLVAKDYEDRKVSVSLLNNFFECPWKWYFRNLLQLPEPKAESLEFGNIVHGAIDNILKLNTSKISDEEVKNIIKKLVLKSGFGDERKQKELEHDAFKILAEWVENRLSKISKDREPEKSVSLSDDRFPHLNIYGKIDLVEILGKDSVRVTDFKTGTPRKKTEIEKVDEEGRMSDYMRQLSMYSYLLGENSKWKKNVTESQLEFVQAKSEKEMFYGTHIDKEHIALLIRDITDYDNLLKNGNWVDRPCDFKSYGKQNAECEYCKMAKIYQ